MYKCSFLSCLILYIEKIYLKYFLECTYTDVKVQKKFLEYYNEIEIFFASPYVSKNLLDLIKIKIPGSRMKFCVRSYYSIFDVPFDVLLVTFLNIAPVLKRQKKKSFIFRNCLHSICSKID